MTYKLTINKSSLGHRKSRSKLFLYPYVKDRRSPCSACKIRIQAVQRRTEEMSKGNIRWASPTTVKDDEASLFDDMTNAAAATKEHMHSLQSQLWSVRGIDILSSGVCFAKTMHDNSMMARQLVTKYKPWDTENRSKQEKSRVRCEALISNLPDSHIRLRY